MPTQRNLEVRQSPFSVGSAQRDAHLIYQETVFLDGCLEALQTIPCEQSQI
jgi:hypothetical protein